MELNSLGSIDIKWGGGRGAMEKKDEEKERKEFSGNLIA